MQFSLNQPINPLKVKSVGLTHKIFFLQNLSVMVRTGISLSVALKTLAQETPSKRFAAVLGYIAAEVDKGIPFAKALSKFQSVFGELFISMVESGEMSGKLDEVLNEVLVQMKKDHELISKVKGAMIYPAIIVLAMGGVAAAMMVFVIPKLTQIFREAGASLPLPTRILIGISDFAVNHGIILLILIVAMVIGISKLLKTKRGTLLFDSVLLKLPVFGEIDRKINLARFSRTLSSLLKTDIPIVQCFTITSRVLGNQLYKNATLRASEQIVKGSGIHTVLKETPKLFPSTVTQMVSVGEETGTVDEILKEIALFYEEDIDQVMKNLPAVIEPVLILLLGLGVGGLAIAIILPLYSLTQQY